MRHRARQYFALLLAVMMMFTALPATALAEAAPQPEGPAPATEQAAAAAEETPPEEEAAPEDEASPKEETAPEDEAAPEGTPEDETTPGGQDQTPPEEDSAPKGEPAQDAPTEDPALPPEANEAPGPEAGDVPTPIAEVASGTVGAFNWSYDDVTETFTLTGSGELNLEILNQALAQAAPQLSKEDLHTVIINDATSIGDGCFENWPELVSVTLPDSVTAIGADAFSHCKRLTLRELPAGVTSIGERAFNGCDALALAELPAGLTVINDQAFYGCASLTLTELPAGLKTIGDFAFVACENLKITKIPEGVTTIGELAFSNCYGITHLTLPESLKSMGNNVFQQCKNLTSLTFLGQTAPAIDPYAFWYADALHDIFIPEGATGYNVDPWPQDKVKVGRTVTVGAADHGSASAAPTYAGEGDTIVLSAVPEAGYHLASWKTEPTVDVTDNRLTMPDADVTVTPVFEAHDFSDEWSSGGTTHWHECVCGEKQGESVHTYSGGVCSTCGYSYECSIFYKSLSGKNLELHVKSTDTVRSVKEQIEKNEGIPVALQQLTLREVLLEDGQFLADCGVIKDSTLHLILRYAPGGTGAADDPYLIPDREQLEAFRYYINAMVSDGGAGKYFKLTADINLDNEPWAPIGTFSGTFDGGGYTISGLNIEGISGLSNEKLGFFRVISTGGMVKDLTVAGSVTVGSYAGGIAGENSGTIDNCRNTCTVSVSDGYGHAGGIVGCNFSGTVKNCSNTGTVTGSYAGGVVGENESTVEGCSNAGPVNGEQAGGIADSNTASGTIKIAAIPAQ